MRRKREGVKGEYLQSEPPPQLFPDLSDPPVEIIVSDISFGPILPQITLALIGIRSGTVTPPAVALVDMVLEGMPAHAASTRMGPFADLPMPARFYQILN